MSAPTNAPLHLVLGDEEFLVERTVRELIAAAVARSGAGEVPVTRLRAGDATVSELAELLGPSLFAEERVVVFEAAEQAGKEPVATLLAAAADPPEGVSLIVVHTGGGRAKTLPNELRKLGAVEHPAGKLRPGEHAQFVKREIANAGGEVTGSAASALVDAVGSNLRELAAAASQLTADSGGTVDDAAVARYYRGRAEVTGFEVADKAAAGELAAAHEALRWALVRGVAPVLIADALADSIHAIARVAPLGRIDPNRSAAELGMAPWKIRKAQSLVRGWRPSTLAKAMQVTAELNGQVKGGAADPQYALERAVDAVAKLQRAEP